MGLSKLTDYYDIPSSGNSVIRRIFHDRDSRYRVNTSLKKSIFEYVAQLRLIDSIVCYSDITVPQITADTYSDVLRVIPIKADEKPGTSVIKYFPKPYFLKCAKRYIANITIEIRDLSGQFIDLKAGIVRVKLRFVTQADKPGQ